MGWSDSGRATVLESEDGPIAVVVHDPWLRAEPALVRAALATARLSIENERLHADLQTQLREVVRSRARIVEAAAAGRRQIERDLHDGAQQRLVNLVTVLALAQTQLARGEPATVVGSTVREAVTEVTRALDELRDIARGIHPAVLTSAGLAAALESLSETAPVPVKVVSMSDRRLPQPIEETLYYVACEAITNAAKHAQAQQIQVRVETSDGEVLLTVDDDGVGGADPEGSGLRGLSDRVEAVGGRFSVYSRFGEGTRVQARLPAD
nr:sensor histidine kinase [Micromonospora tarapacensis]